MTDTPADRPTFAEWLTSHARGTLDDEATLALAELVGAVGHLGKPGKLTLELTVEPAGSGGRTVTIGGRVTTKPPRPAPEVGIFYVGDAGTLHRDDPYAARIPGVPFADTAGDLKLVDPDTGEVRRVDDPATTTDPKD